MSELWNDRTRGLAPYVPGEQPRDQNIIKLNTNENPYPPSPKVIEALIKASNENLRRYPDPESLELREAIGEAYGVKPEQTFAGNGSDEVLAFAFGAFFQEELLFPDITYSFYPVYAKLWGIPFKTIALEADFSISPESFLRPSGGVVFPNPNAPTGMALTLEEARRIVEYDGRRVVLVDEAYGAFTAIEESSKNTPERGIGSLSMVPHIDEYPNLLTVHTLSKMGSLAGLRVGFAIGNEGLIEGLRRVRDSFNSYPVDRLAQAGATAAFRDMAYYRAAAQRIIATRERVIPALEKLGFQVLPSQGNFIFARKPGFPGAEIFAFLRSQGILVRRFSAPKIEDFLRITIGTDGEMDALLEACAKLPETPKTGA